MTVHHLAPTAPWLATQLHVGVGEVPWLAVEVPVEGSLNERACLGFVGCRRRRTAEASGVRTLEDTDHESHKHPGYHDCDTMHLPRQSSHRRLVC